MSLLKKFQQLLVPDNTAAPRRDVTGNDILSELVACMKASCDAEGIGSSLLFNMHFLVILHPDTYEARKYSFPAIAKEAVKAFYQELKKRQPKYDELMPVSREWIFRFGPGTQFGNEPIPPHELRVIGLLSGLHDDAVTEPSVLSGATKVTMKSSVTNVFNRMSINPDAFREIEFTEDGNCSIRYSPNLELDGAAPAPAPAREKSHTVTPRDAFAEIRFYTGDSHAEGSYLMKDKEIVIARKEPENLGYNNYLLIDSAYVSNPHARIRYNEAARTFQIASFSRNETRMNEQLVPQSSPDNPQWTDLNDQAQILLNATVTLRFAKLK
jgi:hypothetical protein